MRLTAISVLLFCWICLLGSLDGVAAQGFAYRGRILDVTGHAVQGAEVFVYDSTNTRRPADFITAKTNRDGRYSIQLPPGNYWAVARVRQGEKYGPLSPGAMHSGEPSTIEDAVDGIVEHDFVVADIREVAKGQRRTNDAFIKVTGRVLDKTGKPANSAYVIAATAQNSSFPEYVSAWTDESGSYSVYLPAGNYYLGAATDFPPGPRLKLSSLLAVDASKIDIAFDVRITLE